MTLSWNEIKSRALKFQKEWEGEERERAEKDTFWNGFFEVFGISRRRVATFEEPVKKLGNRQGFIDLFWKGTLMVEHKSKGKDLDAAYTQATDYFHGLKDHELPKYILVSDFDRFRLYDLDEKRHVEFELAKLHENLSHFHFLAGRPKKILQAEDPVNIEAAELMGKLHDMLEESGYEGHALEVYLVRLLFCLFADDTGIFEKDIFKDYIDLRTNPDGSDLGALMAQFFQVLNTPREKRLKNLDEDLAAFPYINGDLFAEALPIAAFNSRMREMLLICSRLDWGLVSPAIFGSMFQSAMNQVERRNLGAHYTSEKNILKVIEPLFMDGLREEFEGIKRSKKQLREFHKKLGGLKFLDPACGCGNFLIIAYREIRLLELEVLRLLYGKQQVTSIDQMLLVDVDQFYGIEIDEFPARIAEVAMWLMDHLMNLIVSEAFGLYFARLPLKKSANIVNGNALRMDWKDVVANKELDYIFGNPPFYGKHLQTTDQKEDMRLVFGTINGYSNLDYVTAWYILAARYIQKTNIRCSFVSTNSISQGEQTSILWQSLLNDYEIKIHFAHTTFKWSNEARGNAAVYVIIIGFASYDIPTKQLYLYKDIKGEPEKQIVKNINPYLVSSQDVLVMARTKPFISIPQMVYGSKPTDGGNLILSDDEKNELCRIEPQSEKFIRPLVSAKQFISGEKRWCLWLVDASPKELANSPEIMKRVKAVKEFRLNSKKAPTRKAADYPTLFAEIRHKETPTIVIPLHTSENRAYIPLGFLPPEYIVSNSSSCLPNASLYLFGMLTSRMHMAWVKYICGRIKSDFRYSNKLVYNTYPWPKDPNEKNRKAVEEKAQGVLDAREEYPDSSLADLYDPLTMPPKLIKAHQELDRAVERCYRPQPFKDDTARIEYLFQLYKEYKDPLFGKKKKRGRG